MDSNTQTPDLNDVALFVEVVQAESFTRAAKRRGVPVSTASRRIARLEATLGIRLLERTTRRLRLTELGKSYFEHAERAVDELGQGNRRVREQQSEPRGRVRITAPVGLGSWVIESLAPYLLRTPEVTVELDLSERRIDLLAEGFDIAIRGGAVDSADYVARKISESERGLFASRAYLARRGRPKRVDELNQHDLIATRTQGAGASWDLLRDGRRHRVHFKPRLYVNEMLAARDAAQLGVGIALIPSMQADGRLERVLPQFTGESGGLWLLSPARKSQSAAVRTCVEHLRNTLPVAEKPRR